MPQYPDTTNLPDLQVWNNAAFDNGSTTDDQTTTTTIKVISWCPLQPNLLINGSETLKENTTPSLCKSPVCIKSLLPVKPLHPNGATENSQQKPFKLLYKQALLLQPSPTISRTENEPINVESKIDNEIKEIEAEISLLSSKLESLHLKNAERKKKLKNLDSQKNLEKTPFLRTTTKFRQRGVSLGPSEIVGIRSQCTGKPEKTLIQSSLNRRKSCLFKLPEINEDKGSKQRGGRSSSLSPKSNFSTSKVQSYRQGFTTIGSKKSERKCNGILSSIQPKKLFKEEEKSVTVKKIIKNGRVIASRYNQFPIQSNELRKMSLPGNNKDMNKGFDKRRSSVAGKVYDLITEKQTKMPCGIPKETIYEKNLDNFPPLSTLATDILLPRIKTVRCKNKSPRDSGPAKKVVDLIGRKTYFGAEEINLEGSICQALSFDGEEEEDS